MSDFPEIKYARFLTEQMQVLSYSVEGEPNRVISYDMNDPLCAHIVNTFGLDNLKRITLEVEQEEQLKYNKYLMYLERFDEINYYLDKQEEAQKTIEENKKSTLLEQLMNLSTDNEKLFKLKLEIFELDAIKSSKDRKLKSKIRKSKNSLEILSVLHGIMERSDNEQLESQD